MNIRTLCFYANIVIKDMETSEDIVQDVFAKCWTAILNDGLQYRGGGVARIGKRADLLILSQHPLEDLNAFDQPATVIKKGQILYSAN